MLNVIGLWLLLLIFFIYLISVFIVSTSITSPNDPFWLPFVFPLLFCCWWINKNRFLITIIFCPFLLIFTLMKVIL